jgi:4-hydroxybenzoate polyprenyltransferase
MPIAEYSGLSRIQLYLALSRTPHGLLDICAPLFTALLWLGQLPDTRTIVLGILAAFAGYTAVYALNDIVDYRPDKEKICQAGFDGDACYLDGTHIRHPLARGYLNMGEAIVWAGGWAALSLLAAYLLNPACALILVAGGVLEAIYCLLLRISHLRTLVSGIVKTLGPLAAVFAVDTSPAADLLILVFLWIFFWEIGGQNIPADWHDIQEDTALGARTVPVYFGPKVASAIALITLILSLLLSGILFRAAPLRLPLPFSAAGVFMGFYLLIRPAYTLCKARDRNAATVLFNRASWYPCALLVTALSAILYENTIYLRAMP